MSDPVPTPGYDAYSPGEIAVRVEKAGVAKAGLAFLPMFVLALLAGVLSPWGSSIPSPTHI